MVLFTREDFDYQRAAVHGVISCLKVQHNLNGSGVTYMVIGHWSCRKLCAEKVNLHTNGLLARRCYYTLVSVLDAIYDRPAVAEHTGEVVMHGCVQFHGGCYS